MPHCPRIPHVSRRFSRLAIAALALLGCPPGETRAADARPNVLLICADDHAAYVTGCYGNTIVRTPRIDGLAAEGTRFTRAYCNSPVCTASRQSFLTGRYPRTIGVTELKTPLPAEELTLADILGAAGYETAAIGKMHFNSNLQHGFDVRLDAPDHRRWLAQQPNAGLPAGVEVLPRWRPFRDAARIWLNADALPYGATDAQMDATYFATQAAEFLAAQRDEPFFLMVSFTQPHSPFRFPVEFRGRHSPDEFTTPEVSTIDDPQIPAIFRELTDHDKRGIAAAYYTAVEFLDHNVGRVLDALDAAGHRDDTLVIYFSDHGYLLGHHGRFEKHCSFEEAVRVPLVVRHPGEVPAGQANDAMLELIDLAPTVLDACDVESPPTNQGRSFLPAVTHSAASHRQQVIVEYAPHDEIMIRDDRWKLVYWRGAREREDGYLPASPLTGPTFRLYDLESDPQESVDLSEDPQHSETVARLKDALIAHLLKTTRQPELIPQDASPDELLAFCVQPRDVQPPQGEE